MRRGWKASLIAVLTIAVSLFVWGAFLVVGRNLGDAMERWRGEARLIVYLEPGVSESMRRRIEAWVVEARWVDSVRLVSPAEAGRRFQEVFPSLSDLMQGWKESPLPPSLEIAMRSEAGSDDGVESWLVQLAARPGVDLVDDDRDWLHQLESISEVGRTIGLIVGMILLGAATFTIASVIRLAAFMYQDEISVMRLVGATEFLIRGPFYCEGLLQGGLGGLAAAGALYVSYAGLGGGPAARGVLGELFLGRFLSPLQILFLVVVGCLAGGIGAVISLRGEVLASEDGGGG